MIDHRTSETLLAVALDFRLSPDEQASLDAHLAGCDRCRAMGAQLRRDAVAMQEGIFEDAPSQIRMAVESAALQARPQTPRFLLLMAAALLMALSVGGAIILGGLLDLDGLSVNPSPSFPSAVESEPPQPSSAGSPSAAPVGLPPDNLILYADTSTHLETGMFQIHTIRADGTDDRTLAAGNTPTWSPDGRLIAYECELTPSGDPPGSICVMNADGTNNRTLVQGSFPQWSPDGLSIAYSCGVGTADALADICTMDADGSQPAVLVSEAFAPFSSPGGGQFWSPDGSHILFSRSPFDFGDSWVANADGTAITRVGDGRGTWSPDGSWIMLESGVVGPQPDISVVRPDGSDPRLLGNTHAPIWSPDSRRIAFIAVSGALQAFDVESGAEETLDESAWSLPTWLTDNLIAAVGGDDGGLYLINLETGDVRPLTTGIGGGGLIVPSPDGQWLAFRGVVDEQLEIYVAPLTGTGAIRLTTTAGASEFSAWQPFARESTTITFRLTLSGSVPADAVFAIQDGVVGGGQHAIYLCSYYGGYPACESGGAYDDVWTGASGSLLSYLFWRELDANGATEDVEAGEVTADTTDQIVSVGYDFSP